MEVGYTWQDLDDDDNTPDAVGKQPDVVLEQEYNIVVVVAAAVVVVILISYVYDRNSFYSSETFHLS